jgi:hypothetical protein
MFKKETSVKTTVEEAFLLSKNWPNVHVWAFTLKNSGFISQIHQKGVSEEEQR